MPITRNDDGSWVLRIEDQDRSHVEKSYPAYYEALPRYLTALDPAFVRAREKSEFEFLLSLFRVRGVQGPGWDPYETTQRAIPALVEVHAEIKDFEAARHLQLWIYGHILEASEPYEMLANLVDVANGGRFNIRRFPPYTGGRQQSPGMKMKEIQRACAAAGMPVVATPLREIWDRNLRNAVFHADYTLRRDEVRTLNPARVYDHDEIMTLVNRAIAYHHALAELYQVHIGSYAKPEVINVHPGFSRDPEERAVVIVREGYGAVGLKDAWTPEQVRRGKIRHRIGRFTPEEWQLLETDPALALLPAEAKSEKKGFLDSRHSN
jgi:hypothetical protein